MGSDGREVINVSQYLIDRIYCEPETGVRRELVGLSELSERLDVHYKTLLRAIHDGRLRAYQVGRQWKVASDDLQEFMRAPLNRRLSTSCSMESDYDPEATTSAEDSVWYDERGNPVPF